jgi:hypothetical protein
MLVLVKVEILLHSLAMLVLLIFVITLRKSVVKVFALIRLVVIKEDIGLSIVFRNNYRMLSQVVSLERQYQLWHCDIFTISAAISVI